MTARSTAALLSMLAVLLLPQTRERTQAQSPQAGQPNQPPRKAHRRLGMTGIFVVWIVVITGIAAYLSAH